MRKPKPKQTEVYVKIRRVKTCRCPACNPLNLPKKLRDRALTKGKLPPCDSCGGTREVPIEKASLWYLSANDMVPSGLTAMPTQVQNRL